MSAKNNQLPSEEILSREYSVSRAVIREACAKLREQGYIAKTKGRGQVCHPSAFAMENRIDLSSDFRELLGQKFKKVSLKITNCRVNHDSEQYEMEWTYSGDGRPMILGYFQISLVHMEVIPQKQVKVHDLLEFGDQYMFQPISYCAMTLHCCQCAKSAAVFQVDANCSIQRIDEVIYNVEDVAVGKSTWYLCPEETSLSVVTKFR